MQDKIRETTKVMLDIFNEHNIPYWIDFGTLLGAIREQDIIPWDIDADFSIRKDDSIKIYSLLPQIIANTDINLVECWFDGAFKLLPSRRQHSPWWIDIYPWVEDTNTGKVWHSQRNSFAHQLQGWPSAHIFTIVQIPFLGRNANAPVMYKERLTKFYGNFMSPVKRVPYWED